MLTDNIEAPTQRSSAQWQNNNATKRHSRKHEADPFLSLQSGSDSHQVNPPQDEKTGDSLLSKLILTPLILVSFVLSLTLVDFRSRKYRAAEHPATGNSTGSPRSSRWNPLTWFQGPEPYQSDEDRPRRLQKQQDQPDNGHQSWSINKKHRAVAKMELGDAWDMRRSVMVLVLALFGVLCGLLAYGIKKTWDWIMS